MSIEVKSKREMKFYVVRTANTREKSVAEKIIKEGETNLIGRVGQVLVPLEKKLQIKDGKKTLKDNILFPGYIFMETNSVGELKYFLKGLKGTSGFLTSRHGDVEALTQEEVNKMIGKHEESMNIELNTKFIINEEIIIIDGPFNTMKATIEEINDSKVKLSVSIFGRKTPLVLDITQINKL
jgi:transcriptional antiterminator NusG